jgi:tetratricopeptide (TPR) repeat protein
MEFKPKRFTNRDLQLATDDISVIKLFSFFIEFYNKAVEIAPMISPDFASDVAEGRCWSNNHLRSYFRAVHGQANTLRKMGRFKEALEKYLLLEKLDPNFHRYELISVWHFSQLHL